ncbi:hypothetical protein [Vibrio metschnikovii]|uniref:Lipoprotein n=1 Tax=Vibrio metschnikovii TaxID=28172 RepID=A0A9X0RDB5_VIBME|nr:hypothetical protein [Vibrio metschnikovii]MBC5853201.1 hypothetical protein [Vibrio metschnikovii]
MNIKKPYFFGAIISSIIASSAFTTVVVCKGMTNPELEIQSDTIIQSSANNESFESAIKNEPPLEIDPQFHLVSSEPNQITKARMLFTGIDHSQQSYRFDEKIELKSQCDSIQVRLAQLDGTYSLGQYPIDVICKFNDNYVTVTVTEKSAIRSGSGSARRYANNESNIVQDKFFEYAMTLDSLNVNRCGDNKYCVEVYFPGDSEILTSVTPEEFIQESKSFLVKADNIIINRAQKIKEENRIRDEWEEIRIKREISKEESENE